MTSFESLDLDYVDKETLKRITMKIAYYCKARIWVRFSNYKGFHVKILCNRRFCQAMGADFCIARWLFDDQRRFKYDHMLRDHPAKRNVLWDEKTPHHRLKLLSKALSKALTTA
ncbi:hypothetical protein J7L00_04310 [Candidatus Bathyarchaeota archaeon]|nr:hypothetical protein [Candidatus Bathyarchaeota archaeon]